MSIINHIIIIGIIRIILVLFEVWLIVLVLVLLLLCKSILGIQILMIT